MPFKRYVEIGRIAMINFGEEYGKLVVITDVVDQNRALVDSPEQTRRVVSFKRLTLTDLKVEIPRLAKKSVLKKALDEAEVAKKFASSSWGQRIAKRQTTANQTDFDRYKSMVARCKASRAVRKVFNQLKKSAK